MIQLDRYPKIPKNCPKLSKLAKNVHFLVKHSTVFITIKLQCSKLSFIGLWQLEARHFDWYILKSFWLWNLKDGWSLRVYKARNVLPRKNIKTQLGIVSSATSSRNHIHQVTEYFLLLWVFLVIFANFW